MNFKVIAFDADDTLWHNESFFRETENKFYELFENYLPQHTIARELLQTEIKNLGLYGYGIKGFYAFDDRNCDTYQRQDDPCQRH